MRRIVAVAIALAGCAEGPEIRRAPFDLQATPLRYDFGLTAVGASITGPLLVENVGAGTAPIGSMAVLGEAGGAFELLEGWTGSIAGGANQQLIVGFAPTDERLYEDRVTVTLDTEPPTFFEIPLRGRGVAEGLRVWPSVLDFGPVGAGEVVERTLYLENQTEHRLDVLGPRFTGDDDGFALLSDDGEEAPWSLTTGAPNTYTVRFEAPTAEGVEARLRFLDPDSQPWAAEVGLFANLCEGSTDPGWDADGDGWTRCAGDCEDEEASVHPGAVEIADAEDDDCDGLVDEGTDAYDDDGDGFSEAAGDCHDGDDGVYPGADEVADGVDNDCNGTVDDGTLADDADGDGWSAGAGDCEPANSLVFPGATELPDGVDNDCDGTVDEGTGVRDDDGDGFCEHVASCIGGASPGDCDDTADTTWPGATELINGRDDDCDGVVDEGTAAVDGDGDGWAPDGGDCDDTDPLVHPAATETADGADQDCDGVIDEDTPAFDDDGDGYTEAAGDCNDADARQHPGAAEDLAAASPGDGDGIDNDCDGTVDEGTRWHDDDGDGFTEAGGDCNDANIYFSPGAQDPAGDGQDRNCDGAD